jgi:long-chain acyl-CoA synthetase
MGVNTLYAGLVAHPKITQVDFSNLRLAGGGGAAVIAAVSAKWEKITGQIIREGYGLSETSPVLTFNPMYLTEFSGTTGLPMPSTYIRLLDEADRDVAIGEPGEICAKGPQIMSGYWKSRKPTPWPSPPTATSAPATSACSTPRDF